MRKVVGQFVTEALTLTLIGAIVGFGLGVAVSGPMTNSLVSSSESSSTSAQSGPGQRGFGGPNGIVGRSFGQIGTNLNQVTASLTPQIFASAVAITLLIAIIGSAVPAWFIARVRPSEVLRSE